jgi:nicotinate-nucleotide--dimethylbenzimidazole phosphoribosyltransferase
MGIGNTTTSSAVASVLMDIEPEMVIGKGAGLSDDGLKRKINAVKKAIEVNKPNKNDAIDTLSKVGGLDIAGLTGVFIGGAVYKVPIVIDGFISSVAALVAVRINSDISDYIIASHISKETAGEIVLDELGLMPVITADMCVGEGTGAVALFPLLDMAHNVFDKMDTFSGGNYTDTYKVL